MVRLAPTARSAAIRRLGARTTINETLSHTAGDFDGDGRADLGAPLLDLNLAASMGSGFKQPHRAATNLFDIPVSADYDGVGHAELAIFRP